MCTVDGGVYSDRVWSSFALHRRDCDLLPSFRYAGIDGIDTIR